MDKTVRVTKIKNLCYPQVRYKSFWTGKLKAWEFFYYDASWQGDGEYITEKQCFYTKQEARDFLRKQRFRL